MGYNQRLHKTQLSSVQNFNTLVAGTTRGFTALNMGDSRTIDPASVCANVKTEITTNTLVFTIIWQVSQDNSVWSTLFMPNGGPYVASAPAGTGGAITTNYVFAPPLGAIGGFPFVRAAAVNSVATGGAADQVTVSYNYLSKDYQ